MKRLAILMGVLAAALLTLGLGASAASATVLCKTATNPCTGGTYGKGTVIEATLKAPSKSDAWGMFNCSESSMKGEVTDPGGAGTDVTGTFSSVSFSGCGEYRTITVLKPGTFRITSPSGGNGTLRWPGFEITNSLALHCVYSGWGEGPSFALKGGAPASIVTSDTTLARTGGTSNILCGSTEMLTAEYTVTAPESLYVAAS